VPDANSAREGRLRRQVKREGYALQKSHRRDPRRPDRGRYRIIDPSSNAVVAGGSPWDYSMNLDDVERWVTKS
jgi:hypothetical protein